jgi:hypothetical protein
VEAAQAGCYGPKVGCAVELAEASGDDGPEATRGMRKKELFCYFSKEVK